MRVWSWMDIVYIAKKTIFRFHKRRPYLMRSGSFWQQFGTLKKIATGYSAPSVYRIAELWAPGLSVASTSCTRGRWSVRQGSVVKMLQAVDQTM